MSSDKNLELDRLVFFSDAVVAIAITLLVFDLKINKASSDHLTFADFGNSWQKFVAFILSFFIIAIFWKIHHEFYVHIKKINNTLLWYNIAWLLFIVLIPFTSTLISAHLYDRAAIFCYCMNVFMITIFQNLIWDHVAARPDYLKENVDPDLVKTYIVACNLAMLNGVLACVISFFSPLIAFILLFTRLPMFSLSTRYINKNSRNAPKNLFYSRANFRHLTIVGIAFTLLTIVVMYLTSVFVWMYFGESFGHKDPKWNLLTEITYFLSAFIFIYPLIVYFMIREYKKKEYAKSRNYLLVSGIVLLITAVVAYL
jgi:uncharacterized membrane protein